MGYDFGISDLREIAATDITSYPKGDEAGLEVYLRSALSDAQIRLWFGHYSCTDAEMKELVNALERKVEAISAVCASIYGPAPTYVEPVHTEIDKDNPFNEN